MTDERVNILLVDDQPAKLLTYKTILSELGQNLITAESAREALEILLRKEVAVVLVDVYMPETDGFELAAMIREHPRFRETAIIFISAVLLTDADRTRGYAMGGVDYVSVPVIPEVLRAKVKIFVDLYQKTHALERLNRELEERVSERTAELAASTERQMLLAREVDHRARNVVAVMQSILRITRAETMEHYIAAVDGRIGALSNAHRLLADSRWEGADLHRLAQEEFAPYQGGEASRVRIEGPAILLSPAMAQTLALTLHELVTNAAKHGALSVPSGTVSLTWRVLCDTIDFDWIEAGGPEVKPPARRGYGTRVFKAGIEQQLKGTLDFRWRREGLQCTLSIPRSADMAPKSGDAGAPSAIGANGSMKPILLVEDEPTVSMMLSDMLLEFGHTVDGPYSRYSDAMGAARMNDLHAGVLDVNVGGEKIYPLAAILARRKIPFVFVTGYSPDSIDPRFTHIPVLQKPIERQALRAVLRDSSKAQPS